MFNMKKNQTSAETVVKNVLKIKKGERVLIIANPAMSDIAQDLYTTCDKAESLPVLIYQSEKTSFDNAEPAVIAAIKSAPDVIISISSLKLGKDVEATTAPYLDDSGKKYDHIFDYLLDGKKSIRAVWAPGLTDDMFERTVNIDYVELAERCKKLGNQRYYRRFCGRYCHPHVLLLSLDRCDESDKRKYAVRRIGIGYRQLLSMRGTWRPHGR